jgi:hypothetical protein
VTLQECVETLEQIAARLEPVQKYLAAARANDEYALEHGTRAAMAVRKLTRHLRRELGGVAS